MDSPTHQITKKDVDQFKKGRWIPECQLVVQWEREDQRPVRLRKKVDLTGAKAPYNFINLILNPAGQGRFMCGLKTWTIPLYVMHCYNYVIQVHVCICTNIASVCPAQPDLGLMFM